MTVLLNVDATIEFEEAYEDKASERRRPVRVRRGAHSPLQRIGSALVWLLVGFDIFILLFLVVSSFKTTRAIFDHPWMPPASIDFANWSNAWNSSGFGQATLNTVGLVAGSAVSAVVLSAPAAYVLARIRGKTATSMTIFFAMGIGVPSQVIVIPIFVIMSKINLVDSLFGLYIVYTALSIPFTVFLLTAFFRSLPNEIEEAAAIDGASAFRIFVQIMLPLARSGIVTALILNVVGLWNETLIALIFIQTSSKDTLSLALLNFLSTMQYSGADYGQLFAGICILILPVLIGYVWLGRRLIEGITLGAVR
jgi:multiple sugar transport system permease protein/N-acetylglucosamine transport system permease protein